MVRLILGLAVFTVYLLMVLGGVVTSTGSGLACPDWPLCYGTVAPPVQIDIWLEWGHRLLGGAAGLLIFLSAFLVHRTYGRLPRVTVGIASILLLCVAILGGLVVLVHAPMLETVGHTVITSSHIIVSTLILVSLVFTYHLVRSSHLTVGGTFPYAVPLFFLAGLQAVVGVVVRYSGAGLACPDFPLCRDAVVPPLEDFSVLIHLAHRVLALFLVGFTLLILVRRFNARTLLTFLLVFAQATSGVLSVLTTLFLPVVFFHIAIGFFLLGWLAYHAAPALFAVRLAFREAGA
jgi:cytochrome c oxidase assembly protein subunit 15